MLSNRLIAALARSARILFALICAVAWLPVTGYAQTVVPSLTINTCDGASFPNVTCLVTAINRNGLPEQALNADSFEVSDASGATVAENVNSGVMTSLLFVIDLSASLRGTTAQTLKDAIDTTLDEMAKDSTRANDQVAMIALTKAKLDLGTNPSSPPIDPETEVDFSVDKVLPRNILRSLSAATATPLYDGVRKALLLSAKQELGHRAIVVLSDGVDSKSSQFTLDNDIDQAQRENIPIYTVKFGQRADSAKLQRLALDTGGELIPAGAPAEISAAVRKIQDRLKTQYTITFKSAATGKAPEVTIRWKTPTGVVEQKAPISNMPAPPPALSSIKVNGATADLNNTPLKGEVTLTPQLAGGAPATVEYVLNGKTTIQKQAPFAFTFQADDLPETSTLIVRITSSAGLSATQSFTLKRDVPVVVETPEPTPAPSFLDNIKSNPVLAAAIAVAVIGLLVLIIIIGILISRRRRVSPAFPAADYAIATSVQPNIGATAVQPSFNNPSTQSIGTQAMSAPGTATVVFGATQVLPGSEGGKTMVWQPGKARVEFSSGSRAGEKMMIGMPGRKIIVGREVKDSDGNIQVKSQFVSRQHAELTVEGDQMMVTDLGSASGTLINGERLKPRIPTPIKVGDKVEFADIASTIIDL